MSTNTMNEVKDSSEKVDVQLMMDRHQYNDETKNIIEKENLLPYTLLQRLHTCYPQHSGIKEEAEFIFTEKNHYSGKGGFREILGILEKNNIQIGHYKERELFIDVYRFLATKHVLNTINWNDFATDSVFQLVFPQPGMMKPEVTEAYLAAETEEEQKKIVEDYMELTNPHDGKQQLNKPWFKNDEGELEVLEGSQHKYPQCHLIFDKTTQSCFAFCTYCFRHAQVRGDEDMFIQKEVRPVHEYMKRHKEITDLLITGGDGGYMPYERLKSYVEPLMTEPELMHIRTLRIGSRALTFHPEMILTKDYENILGLFRKLTDHGIQVAWMGHFSTPRELLNISTIAAARRLKKHGVMVKSQSPVMNHISLFTHENGKVDIDRSAQNWIDLGHVLGMNGIGFHSMYCARPTGEHQYFTTPLADLNKVFSKIYRTLPSISRPSRYITMTSSAGKTSMLGEAIVGGKKAFVLKFNESRNMEWMDKVYLAKYDENQNTIEKLEPLDTDEYFYSEELKDIENKLEETNKEGRK